MKLVLVHLKDRLNQKELEEAEARARARGMSLEEWLTAVLKEAIHRPATRPAGGCAASEE